ncbi:hypothetical protein MMC31_002346, partial [Peltigera leucophlebia]|nr:hypothetical protein [Peltigera leucophlebia]
NTQPTAGDVPTQVLAQQVDSAPTPGQRMASGYPQVYQNQGGSRDGATRNFDTKELRQGAKLHEYPITGANKRPLNFTKRAANPCQVERPVHPNDVAMLCSNRESKIRALQFS